MKEEKLFETIADIDEKYVAEAREKAKQVKTYPWMKWAAMAACLCIVAVGILVIPKLKTPEDTKTPYAKEESAPVSATITLYNNERYIALVTPDAVVSAGLPEEITDNIVGEHLAYLELNGDVADYVESDKKTDIELYRCLVDTPEEVLILRDGDNRWPVKKLNSGGAGTVDQPEQNDAVITETEEDFWSGCYLDDSGNWVVWLTENTPENQQRILDQNPDLAEESVTFKEATYSLSYLNGLMEVISQNMSAGKLPFVSSAMLSEQTNRVEVYVNTEDQKLIDKVLSLDTKGGAITIIYSDNEGVEE